jgi:hypothetical protein
MNQKLDEKILNVLNLINFVEFVNFITRTKGILCINFTILCFIIGMVTQMPLDSHS